MRTVKELLLEWYNQISRRRALAESRLLLGIEHAKCNAAVVVLEEELIERFGGTDNLLPSGQVVTIGTKGCNLSERMRVYGNATGPKPNFLVLLPTWEACEAKADLGAANPIEQFIYDNEPADGASGGAEWREQLRVALVYAHTHCL